MSAALSIHHHAPDANAAATSAPAWQYLPHGDYERVWAGYSGAGGLSRLRELLQQLARTPGAGRAAPALLRKVQDGTLLVFPLRHELWLPNFQFHGDAFDVLTGVAQAIDELRYVFDAVEMALWFCTPNAWLQDEPPLRVVALAPEAVRAAARADRYVAAG